MISVCPLLWHYPVETSRLNGEHTRRDSDSPVLESVKSSGGKDRASEPHPWLTVDGVSLVCAQCRQPKLVIAKVVLSLGGSISLPFEPS